MPGTTATIGELIAWDGDDSTARPRCGRTLLQRDMRPMTVTPRYAPRLSTRSRWWNLLLLIPFVALLWVPFYNRLDPTLFGIPFFYWYQFLWVFLTSLLTWLCDPLTRPTDVARAEGRTPE
jgi:uncharacterized protein DUF3311